jgi:hypothetical protein
MERNDLHESPSRVGRMASTLLEDDLSLSETQVPVSQSLWMEMNLKFEMVVRSMFSPVLLGRRPSVSCLRRAP